MSVKLTETEQLLLSAAVNRDDRCVVLPSNLKGGAAQKVAAKLIAAGLVKELLAKPKLPAWRRDEDTGRAYALKLTAAGAKAITSGTVGPAHQRDAENDACEQTASVAPATETPGVHSAVVAGAGLSSLRSGTKIAKVVELLDRENGATLDELVASTDWLPHTTRAALTGLRKRGYAVWIDRSDKMRGSAYRIGRDGKPASAETPPREDTPSTPSRRSGKSTKAAGAPARKAA
jgi:hypothetical protein